MDKKERLMGCAIKLFAKEGITQAGTSAIARAAGVAAGTLFNYFPTKDELIDTAYIECKREMLAHIIEGMDPNMSFQDMLRHFWWKAIRWSLANLDKHDFVRQFKNSPRASNSELKAKLGEEHQFFMNAWNQAEERGEVEKIPHDFREKIMMALYDATIEYMRDQDESLHEESLKVSFALASRALSGVPADVQ